MAVEKLRYQRKPIALVVDNHKIFNDAFQPMGELAENVRTKPGPLDELRQSMRDYGWSVHHPAVKDERGVVLVGHRRLEVAKELGIPVRDGIEIMTHTYGIGDAADLKRFEMAVGSNLGSQPFSAHDRKKIAASMRIEGWAQADIATALKVNQATISRDLETLCTVNNVEAKDKLGRKRSTGRPRKSTGPTGTTGPKDRELAEKMQRMCWIDGKSQTTLVRELGKSTSLTSRSTWARTPSR